MDEISRELVRSWLLKADSDLRSARALLALQEPATDTAVFHCHMDRPIGACTMSSTCGRPQRTSAASRSALARESGGRPAELQRLLTLEKLVQQASRAPDAPCGFAVPFVETNGEIGGGAGGLAAPHSAWVPSQTQLPPLSLEGQTPFALM